MKHNPLSLSFFKTVTLGEIGGPAHYRKAIGHLIDYAPWITRIPLGDGGQFNPQRLSEEQTVVYISESAYHQVYIFRPMLQVSPKEVLQYYYLFHIDASTNQRFMHAYFFKVNQQTALLSTGDLPKLLSLLDDNMVWVEDIRLTDNGKVSQSPNLHAFTLTDPNLRQVAKFFLNMIMSIRYG